MDVRGYSIGPIDAKGACTSEIDLPPIIKPGPLNTLAEVDRPHLVEQPGMRHKYLPLRHDPATGAISTGGRYLFRGYEDATRYRDFLEAKVFPSEQTTFWKRPFFYNTSVSAARLTELGARKIFDRTSLNLAVWLPLSEQAGGVAAIWPNSPPIPLPGVEHLGGAQPKAA